MTAWTLVVPAQPGHAAGPSPFAALPFQGQRAFGNVLMDFLWTQDRKIIVLDAKPLTKIKKQNKNKKKPIQTNP